MQRFARIIATALPLAMAAGGIAQAEDVVIRIEAKRGALAATEAAEAWASSFPDVVTFPLADGWMGIALGPMPREEAGPRLADLLGGRKIPSDSFIAPAAGRQITAVAPADTADADAEDDQPEKPAPTGAAGSLFNAGVMQDAQIAPGQAAADDGDDASGDQPAGQPVAETNTETGPAADMADQPDPQPAPLAETFYIRIESTTDRKRADETLAKYRETLPEAGLWLLPNGRFAVAFGPMPRDAGEQWLSALRNADALPRDAFLSPAADMGKAEDAGQTPELGQILRADEARPPMPPLADIQRALRWAGRYDGAIDGKDGPMTRAAIAREVVAGRASPDTATAMTALLRQREEWRRDIGLDDLRDDYTGLSLPAPMDRLQFDRHERALSIYAPRNGSGAALILFSQPGGQQEMLDLTGLITALGWVPAPDRRIAQGAAVLTGRNDTHIGHAEAQVVDGNAQGFVLIWPAADAANQPRIASEISEGLNRFAAPQNAAAFGAIDARNAAETAPEQPEAPAGPDTSR